MTCTYTPAVLPTTVATPAPRPSVSERVTTNSTLGPGMRISTNAKKTKASRCSVGSMRSRAYRRRARAAPSRFEPTLPARLTAAASAFGILNHMVQYPQIDRAFAALADPTRRAILERLGRGSATITELAEPFGISLTG